MSTLKWLCYPLLAIPCLCWAREPAKKIEAIDCFLIEREALVKALESDPANPQLKTSLQTLDGFVLKRCESVDCTVGEKNYYEGYLAWVAGDRQKARNMWFKVLELVRRGLATVSPQRFKEVEEHCVTLEATLQEERARSRDIFLDGEEPMPQGAVKKTKRQRPRKSSYMTSPSTPPPTRELVIRAMRAHQDGQLEQAKRLYERAQKIDPGSAEVQQQLAELAREME
ncbi:MAG: hypothetical protein LHV69_05135 [Elusimicrobia bacterium]|nr:hypothetical protein [Candidatus Obscuribacterium magneticum]